VNADDSARMRDLLASNRTLLAWIRTSISFAGLGFVVAKFGRGVRLSQAADYLGILLALIGLLLIISGYAQHKSVVRQEKPPPGAPVPIHWPAVLAAACCALTCALIVVYLAVTAN
jgi:putative membrane protein